MWAHEHYGVQPDAISFGKKTQVCGTAVGRRVEEIAERVFRVPSRLNSTWGGNLVDMVRCQRILEIIHEDKLVDNAARQGEVLLHGLQALVARHGDWLDNARGRGLMCAFDVRDAESRKRLLDVCVEHGLMLIACGERSVRFRPALVVTTAELQEALAILERAVASL